VGGPCWLGYSISPGGVLAGYAVHQVVLVQCPRPFLMLYRKGEGLHTIPFGGRLALPVDGVIGVFAGEDVAEMPHFFF